MQAPASMQPQGIAGSIITYGANNNLGRKLKQLIRDYPDMFYEEIDIRRLMPRDPLGQNRFYKVQHNENGDYLRTQTAMMNDGRFYNAVLSVVGAFEELAVAEDLNNIATHPR